MRRDAILKAAYFAVLAIDGDPSVRTVQAMAKRVCGKALQTADVMAFMRTMRDSVTLQSQASNGSVTSAVLKLADSVTPKQRSSNPHGRVVKVLELEAIPLPDGNGASQPALFESWQDAIEREALQLSARPLADLTNDELYCVGQLHALRFTRYRSDEGKNRKLGITLASRIKNVVTSKPSFRDLTLREYLVYGQRIYDALPHDKRGKEWRTPWDVTVNAI